MTGKNVECPLCGGSGEVELSLSSSLGARVKALRARAKVTQRDLSKKSGISQPTLSRLEIGNQEWTTKHIEAVAAALGCTTRDLLDGH